MRAWNNLLILGCGWVILVTASVGGPGCCGSASSRRSDPQGPPDAGHALGETRLPDRVLAIGGMTCGGCEKPVQRALGQVPGVSRVSVDYSSGLARLWLDHEDIPATAMAGAVSGAGFQARSLRNTDLRVPRSAAATVASTLKRGLGTRIEPMEVTIRLQGETAMVRVWHLASVSARELEKELREAGLEVEVLPRQGPGMTGGQPRGR